MYGFEENSVSWFKSYLGGRTQLVQVESKWSDVMSVGDHGAPQGSVLAGLIFIIYSNDFPASSVHGQSIVYVDDNTDIVSHANPNVLQTEIQMKADDSSEWLKDNRMCVAGTKSKLLIIGIKQQKKAAYQQVDSFSVTIDGQKILESKSEKLLGLVISNDLTWRDYLHGEGCNIPGLICQLSRRVGMIKRLSKCVSKQRLKIFTEGLFYSKLNYCLPVFGHVFGLDLYHLQGQKFAAYSKADNRKLQVLQNTVMRILSGNKRDIPTIVLLEQTNSLSVHQSTAYQTLVLTHKIINTRKPAYLATKMCLHRDSGIILRSQEGNINQERYHLNSSRSRFLYRSAKLFNRLPTKLKLEERLRSFKHDVRIWVKENVAVKP